MTKGLEKEKRRIKIGVGDDIMVAGRARVMQMSDPRKVRPTYQGKLRWNTIWDNNPRIARPGENCDFQVLVARDMKNNRPYHTFKTPEKWGYNLAFRPDVGEIYLSEEEKEIRAKHAGRIIIEPHIKPGASPNKQWGENRWQALCDLILASGIRPAQIGPAGTKTLRGAELIETPTFRHGCAVLAGAMACVLPEGGLHHSAAALGVPAVVIFGNFTPVELTGYAIHRNIGASLGEACGMRTPCPCCEKAMARITPWYVCDELRRILDDRERIDRGVAENAA